MAIICQTACKFRKAPKPIDRKQVFEPARMRTPTQTHVFTETASYCNLVSIDVISFWPCCICCLLRTAPWEFYHHISILNLYGWLNLNFGKQLDVNHASSYTGLRDVPCERC